MQARILLLIPILAFQASSRADGLDDFIKQYMKERSIPGLAIAVMKDGKIVRQGAYGNSNEEWGVKTTKDTVFEIGSVSKHFTDMALLQLMEEGKLGLEDPIGKYVENLPAPWRPVTLDQLMHHTSGIPDMEEIAGYGMYRKEFTPEGIFQIANSKPMDFKPGEGWHYSNTGYYVLGMVIEKVSGKKYAEVLKQRLWDPAGLKVTQEADPWRIIPNRAQGYEKTEKALENRDAIQPSACMGAGTIVSTLADMAQWLNTLDQKKLLKPATWDMVYKPVKLKDGTEVPYGMGWFVSPFRGHKSYEHSGGTAGYSCDIRRFPDEKVAVIILTNLYATGVNRIVIRAADKYIPGLSLLSLKPLPNPDPAVHDTIRKAIADVAKGGTGSPHVTDGQWKAYSQASRDAWKDRLAKMKSLEFLKRDQFTDRTAPHGDKIVWEYTYKLTLKDGTILFPIFGITPEGKLGAQGRVEE